MINDDQNLNSSIRINKEDRFPACDSQIILQFVAPDISPDIDTRTQTKWT